MSSPSSHLSEEAVGPTGQEHTRTQERDILEIRLPQVQTLQLHPPQIRASQMQSPQSQAQFLHHTRNLKRVLQGGIVSIAKKRKTSHAQAIFRFMDLPGELRNRVYDIFAKSAESPVPLRPRVGTHGRAGIQVTVANISQSALAQVCKKVRKEYKPIHTREATIAVRWNDHIEFLEEFYGINKDLAKAPQKFIIYLSDDDFGCTRPPNFMPLFRMHAQCSDFECHFQLDPTCGWKTGPGSYFNEEDVREECRLLNPLFNLKNEAWISEIKGGTFDRVRLRRLGARRLTDLQFILSKDWADRTVKHIERIESLLESEIEPLVMVPQTDVNESGTLVMDSKVWKIVTSPNM